MKNILKKAFAVVSALALVATGVAVSPASAEAALSSTLLGTACISFNAGGGSWWPSSHGALGAVEIYGDGDYEVTMTPTDTWQDSITMVADGSSNYFVIDIMGLAESLELWGNTELAASDITISNVSIVADSTTVTSLDTSKIFTNIDWSDDDEDGDYDGNIRINIINPWGDDDNEATDALCGESFTFTSSVTVKFTLSGTGYEADTEDEDDGNTDDGDTDDDDTTTNTTTDTTTTGSTTTDSTTTDSTSTDSTSTSSTTDSTTTDSTSASSTTDSTTTTDTTSTSSSTSDSNSTSATTGEASTFVIVMVCVVAIAGVAFSMKKAR